MESKLSEDQVRKLTKLFDNLNAIDASYDTQGMHCFEKIFEIAPEALQLYPFRDEKGEEYVRKLARKSGG